MNSNVRSRFGLGALGMVGWVAGWGLVFLLFGYAGWNRDFARIGVPGFPVFLTEMLLFPILAVWGLVVLGGREAIPRNAVTGLLALLGLWALVTTVWTWDGRSAVLVARDLTMVGYGLFGVVAGWLLWRDRLAGAALGAVVAGAVLGTASLWIRFVLDPTIVRFGHLGHSALGYFALFSAYVLVRYPTLTPMGSSRWRYLVTAMLLVQVVASGYRTLIAVGLMMVLWGAVVDSWARWKRVVVGLGGYAVVLAATVALAVGVMFAVSPDYVTNIATIGERFIRLARDGLGSESSFSFRAEAWEGGMDLLSTSPWVGVGPGVPIHLYDEPGCFAQSLDNLNCGNPHNTYIAFALRFGVVGLGLLFALLGYVLYGALRWRVRDDRSSDFAEAWRIMAMGLAVYGLTGLMFESPFLCVPFWIAVGVVGSLDSRPHGGNRTPTR